VAKNRITSWEFGVDPRKIHVFLKDFAAPRVTAAAVDGESIKTYMEFASRANRPWRGSGEKSNHKAGCWGRSPQNIKFLLDFALPQATPAAAYGQSIRT